MVFRPGRFKLDFSCCSFQRFLCKDPESSSAFRGMLEASGLRKRFALCSAFLKSDVSASVSLLQALLLSSFLEFSSTWCLPFQLNEHGCKHREIHDVEWTKKIAPFMISESFLQSTSLRVGFWSQHISFGSWRSS